MITLPYSDVARFYDVTLDMYAKPTLGEGHEVPALYEQSTSYQHSNFQDANGGAPRLVLPADDPYVIAQAQHLEGAIVSVNPFGTEEQFFKVEQVTPGRDLLLGNQLQHVECQLKPIEVDV